MLLEEDSKQRGRGVWINQERFRSTEEGLNHNQSRREQGDLLYANELMKSRPIWLLLLLLMMMIRG